MGGEGTGDEQAVVGCEGAHDARQDGVLVLDAVRLVDDDVAPVELLEVVLLLDDHLVAGHHHVELAHRHQVLLLVRLQPRQVSRSKAKHAPLPQCKQTCQGDQPILGPSCLACMQRARAVVTAKPRIEDRNLCSEATSCGGVAVRHGLAGTPTRSSWLPWNLTARMTGHHLRNSLIQLCSVDLGTITMCGPWMPRNSCR